MRATATPLDRLFPRLTELRHATRPAQAAALTPPCPQGGAPQVGSTVRPEIVVLLGSPAAGKSIIAADLAAGGHVVLSRDVIGGSLDGICALLECELAAGTTQVVLAATWSTRAARRPIFEVAARRGAVVRAIWVDLSNEDAQINARRRLSLKYGKLPDPSELARLAKVDPHAFGPRAIISFRRQFETLGLGEGLVAIDLRRFERIHEAPGARGAICWCRKPLPGLAIELLQANALGAASLLAIGATSPDRISASRLGARYVDVAELVSGPLTERKVWPGEF